MPLTGLKAVSWWRAWTDLHNQASTSVWSEEGPCRSMRTVTLLFVREDATLVAQGFDTGGRVLLRGSGAARGEHWHKLRQSGYAEYSASSNGVLAYLSRSGGQSRLEWRDRAGQLLSTLGEAGDWGDVALSPDGTRVAATRSDAQSNSDLWVHDVARNTQHPIYLRPRDRFPAGLVSGLEPNLFQLLPGWRWLVREGREWCQRRETAAEGHASGAALPQFLRRTASALLGARPEGKSDLWVLSVDGEPKPDPFLATDFDERRGQFSPDGRWVAYKSNESGRYEIYVRGFPGAGGKWKVSVAGGTQPRWRRDGREIYYVAPDNKLMAVEVKPSGAALEVGSPKELFAVKLP